MKKNRWPMLSVAIGAVALLSACSDPSAPVAAALNVTPLASHTGGPAVADFRTFAGQLWVCPDVAKPATGFLYRWKIVNNATNLVVQSGVSTNVTAGACIMLASVPTSPKAHYTATVREDPGARYKISSITATYGSNLPIAAPIATVDISGKSITGKLSSDYGVKFTFYH